MEPFTFLTKVEMKLIYYAKPYLFCNIDCVVLENLFTHLPPFPHWWCGNFWGEGVLETIKNEKKCIKLINWNLRGVGGIRKICSNPCGGLVTFWNYT